MRRHERRRGAKVTGDADPEGVESRKALVGNGRWVLAPSRQQPLVRYRQAPEAAPGSEAASSLTWRLCGNQGDPDVGAREVRTLGQV